MLVLEETLLTVPLPSHFEFLEENFIHLDNNIKIISIVDYKDVKKHRFVWKFTDCYRFVFLPAGAILYGISDLPEYSKWPTAYHGTTIEAAVKILEEGFKIQPHSCDAYKNYCKSEIPGFYFAPDPKMALTYANSKKYNFLYEVNLIFKYNIILIVYF